MSGPDKVKLTPEDKAIFKDTVKVAGAMEILTLWQFCTDHKTCFTKTDWNFICSCLGHRSERLLRNVATKFQWED